MKKILMKYSYIITILIIILAWQLVCSFGLVPSYIIPSPASVVRAFVDDFFLLLSNAYYTIIEATIGLLLSVIFGVFLAVLMETNTLINNSIYPIIVFTQTIPTIAIAPLFILWFGYGLLPKILLVFVTCFFPITINVFSALNNVDIRYINMIKTFGATKKDIYLHVKLPFSLVDFFSALKISSSYAIISAVVSEWLGGNNGLGVYMTRVQKSFAIDKMFAVILLISLISMLLLKLVSLLENIVMPWKSFETEN